MAILTDLIVEWKDRLEREQMPVESTGNKLLCMNQFRFILNTTRIPGERCDTLFTASPGQSRHVLVLYKKQFFSMQVYSGERRLSRNELQAQISKIVEMEKHETFERQEDVAILTSLDRTTWALARRELGEEEVNRRSFEEIETAIFVFCMDDTTCPSMDERLTLTLLGTDCQNRFFDKSTSFISFADGNVGINGGSYV